MTASEREKAIIKHMTLLKCTREEAEDMVECDERIDRGEKLFELTPEQEKASKKARQADRKPTVYKLDNTGGKRSRKADTDKQEIMRKLLDCFDEYAPQVINAEREFTFTYNGKKFKIVLSAPRT